MSKKTKYNKQWEKDNLWLKPCSDDPFSAKCNYCDKTFLISGSGISQVNAHAKGKSHIARTKQLQDRQSKIDTRDGSISIFAQPMARINMSAHSFPTQRLPNPIDKMRLR